MHAFDTTTSTWTDLTNLLKGPTVPARCGHGFVAAGGVLYVFDGSGNVGKIRTDRRLTATNSV